MADSTVEIDDRSFIRRSCFVVMPFGHKIETNKLPVGAIGAVAGTGATVQVEPGVVLPVIDFDTIYRDIIKAAVDIAAKQLDLTIKCVRSDEASHAGFIHRDMLEHVVNSDIAIVDITTQNANVFYELGVRHSYRRATTILIRRAGTQTPFNIAGLRIFSYDDGLTADASGKSPLQKSRDDLIKIIKTSVTQRENDSLVHHLLPNTNVVRDTWPIMEKREVWYDVLDRNRKPLARPTATGEQVTRSVGFITGDIMQIRDVDVWVNPENTKMQMDRFHDGSVSSNIRYYGARKSPDGRVVEDTIHDALLNKVGRVGGVEPGVVIATGPGALRDRNGVRMILHVAALQGEPGKGYMPIRDYPACVRRVLEEVDRLNALPPPSNGRTVWGRKSPTPTADQLLQGQACKSVIFPLFGTRSFGQHPQTVAEQLYRAAVVFFEQNPSTSIEIVSFLAHTDVDRDLCERAIGLLESQRRIMASNRPGEQLRQEPAPTGPVSSTKV